MKPLHTYQPTEAEIAWGAGLYEGEGNIYLIKSYNTPRMVIVMTDSWPVRRMQEIFGGAFEDARKSPSRGSVRKPIYTWRLNSWVSVTKVARTIYPYLCSRRREQIDAVLEKAPANPPGSPWICPTEPVPSTAGYLRHTRKGEPACRVCLDSVALYRKLYPPKTTLACPPEPIPSVGPIQRHYRLGIPPCEICTASNRLYKPKKRQEKISNSTALN